MATGNVSANINLAGGEKFSIAGLMMVDERKLQALPEAQILRLFRSGDLAWVYSHLISISNFNRLPDNARASGAPTPAKPAAAASKTPTPQKPAKK